MTKTHKIIIVVLVLIADSFVVDLLNYKDWLLFSVGLIILILSFLLITDILFSIFKPKNKTK